MGASKDMHGSLAVQGVEVQGHVDTQSAQFCQLML